jgi:hypothetical protein
MNNKTSALIVEGDIRGKAIEVASAPIEAVKKRCLTRMFAGHPASVWAITIAHQNSILRKGLGDLRLGSIYILGTSEPLKVHDADRGHEGGSWWSEIT